MYMDDMKLIAKNLKKKNLKVKLRVRIYSQVIGMKFSKEKCPMLVMKSVK